MRKPFRLFLIVVLGIFITFALLDTIGVFDDKTWYEVPHGNHSHYLPKDCDPPLPMDSAPTTAPGPEETIDCTGRIVPISR